MRIELVAKLQMPELHEDRCAPLHLRTKSFFEGLGGCREGDENWLTADFRKLLEGTCVLFKL